MRHVKEIRILNLKSPSEGELNDGLQFFSKCFGMFGKRDREKSCFRIFVHLLRENDSLSSEELAQMSNLSRATVIHHASRLIDSGLVERRDNVYFLRFRKLEDLTRDIERDVSSTFKRLRGMAREIDEEMGRG